MFKRSAALLLMVLYIVTVSGFALNFHYCFNRLSSVRVDAPASSCIKFLQAGKMKCCKNSHVDVKVKDAHQGGSLSFLAKVFAFDMPRLAIADYVIPFQNPLTQSLVDRGPPPLPDIPVFLKNCSFRI